MRKLIMGHEVHPLPPDSHIQLVRELSAIGNNINQLAKVANSTHRVPQGTWDAIQKSLDHLWEIYYGDN